MAEPLLVEGRTGVVLGQHVLERRVVTLDLGQCVVDKLADGGLPRLRFEMTPARLARHPEDVIGAVLVRILLVGALSSLGFEPGMGLFECVGNVLEEGQPEDHMLVLGRIHRAP